METPTSGWQIQSMVRMYLSYTSFNGREYETHTADLDLVNSHQVPYALEQFGVSRLLVSGAILRSVYSLV